jgi:hypothetical protein
MRTETKTIYIAEDGKKFSNEMTCKAYELSLHESKMMDKIKPGSVFECKDGYKVVIVSYCADRYLFSNNIISSEIKNPFVLFVNLSDNPKIIGVTKEQMCDYLTKHGYKYVGKVTTNFVREN